MSVFTPLCQDIPPFMGISFALVCTGISDMSDMSAPGPPGKVDLERGGQDQEREGRVPDKHAILQKGDKTDIAGMCDMSDASAMGDKSDIPY